MRRSRRLCLVLAFTLLVRSPVHAGAGRQPRSAPAPREIASGDADPITDPELRKEIEIGRKALAQIEEKWPLTSDPAAGARLNMILTRLEPHMERRMPYEIRLVSTDVQNAFCLPGGFIFFTTGILDLLRTDSELAAVMAHEMVHADRKHGLKIAARSNKVTLAALAVMLLSGGALAPVVLAQVAQVAITNAYSIELEAEADSRGLDALIASGYPPSGMITLMEKFMNEELKQPIREYGIYMNHPDSRKRLQMALKKLQTLGIPVRRKVPLGLLRTGIREAEGRLELTVDGAAVWGGNNTPGVRTALEKVRGVLDEDLQMELAPYDVHIVENSLCLGNRSVTGPMEGMDSLDSFRRNLLRVLDAARRKHPTAKYFH
ncbi:MAG: M48 family metalloprotease [Fretibacterium sp.]|nr:M48 family metalloprotease [Fretibacterium sp.]